MENHLNDRPTDGLSLRDYYNLRLLNTQNIGDLKIADILQQIRSEIIDQHPHFFVKITDPSNLFAQFWDLEQYDISYDDLLFFDGIDPDTMQFSIGELTKNNILVICANNELAVKLKCLIHDLL